jgi:hypothetical protein
MVHMSNKFSETLSVEDSYNPTYEDWAEFHEWVEQCEAREELEREEALEEANRELMEV